MATRGEEHTVVRNLVVGGLRFDVTADSEYRFLDIDPAYEAFVNVDNGDGSEQISVRVSLVDAVRTDFSREKLFSGTGSWVAYASGDLRSFVFFNSRTDEPTHSVTFNPYVNGLEIACSRTYLAKQAIPDGVVNVLQYPLDQLVLMYLLALRQGFVVHAAGAVIDGKGYAFAGASGAGKTSAARMLAGDEKIEVVSDDRVILRRGNKGWDLYGTPWPGEGGMAVNRCVPLAGLFLLEQSGVLACEQLRDGEGCMRLLPLLSLPWFDEEFRDRSLEGIESLVRETPMRTLRFPLGCDLAALVRKTIG